MSESRQEYPHLRVPAPGDRLYLEPPPQYPAAMINVTNRCNLTCSHCYLYVDGNPNAERDQIPDDELLVEVERLRDRHGIIAIVWMGGEPMIRRRFLERAVSLFSKNTIATNGTIALTDLGPTVTYVVSLDGPPDLNDELRGAGVYAKARANVMSLAADFSSVVQVQCVVTRSNQHRLRELVVDFIGTRADGITFSFFCPAEGEQSELAWPSLSAREEAVDLVLALKDEYPRFVWNSRRALELMRVPTADLVTSNCPAERTVMPLYVSGGQITTPRCCHGNKVDCARCGAWVVFSHAAKIPGPWDEVLPPTQPYGFLAQTLLEAPCLESQQDIQQEKTR